MGLKEFGANLLAEAKRLPWWAWILIGVAVYLGYKLITSGAGDMSSQDQTDPLNTDLPGLSDITGPIAGPGSTSPNLTQDLPDPTTLFPPIIPGFGPDDNEGSPPPGPVQAVRDLI